MKTIKTPVIRTTVRVNASLLDQAKAEAAKSGITLTELMEEGLRMAVSHRKRPKPRPFIELPTSTSGGGLRPGIDLNNSAQLWDLLDEPELEKD